MRPQLHGLAGPWPWLRRGRRARGHKTYINDPPKSGSVSYVGAALFCSLILLSCGKVVNRVMRYEDRVA